MNDQRGRSFVVWVLGFALLGGISCQSPHHRLHAPGVQPFPSGTPSPIALRTLRLGPRQKAHGRQWMMASDAPRATEAAGQILKEGGNLVDAAVAASFVGGVEHPQSTGIGGGGFWIYHSARDQTTYAWDFRERAPFAIRPEMYAGKKEASLRGGLAVATPGLVAGLFEIHRKHGRLPWKKVVEPARKLAQEGVQVDSLLAQAIAQVIQGRRPQDLPDAAFRKLIFPRGRPLREGDTLRQPQLARSLEKIGRKGAVEFYQGSIARSMVQSVRARGGVLSLEDLKKYSPREVKPIEICYGSDVLKTMPIPSSGGLLLGEMLGMLTHLPGFSEWRPYSAQYYHALIEVMRRAYRDRALYWGDRKDVRVQDFLNESYWKSQAASIAENRASRPEELSVFPVPPPRQRESQQTTHYSLMDAEGNAIATTQTINYLFGSEVMAEGTGVLLNNEMDDFSIGGAPNVYGLAPSEANAVEPGKTPLSSMTPTLVWREGKVMGSLGAPGGSQIPTTVLQEYLRFFVQADSLESAFEFPRVHQQYSPLETRIEPVGRSSEREALGRMGHIWVSEMSGTRISLVRRLPDGQFLGIADPRASGQALGQ